MLLLFSTPYYVLIIGVEIFISNYYQKKLYTFKDTITNLYLMLLNATIDFFFRAVYVGIIFTFLYHHKIAISWKSSFVYWFCLVLAEDFLYYWLHRFDHKIRFFWASHVTHHSSEKMNFTVGFRSSVFQPLYRFIYFIPLPLLGFKPLDIVFVYSATQIWGIFVHTELIKKMGFLEYFLVTPSHHRVHHGSNPKYIDKNMGMFLIIWDKLFGTFQPELNKEDYEEIKYGLTTQIKKTNAINIVFHDWFQMYKDSTQPGLTLKQRWLYIFGKPGYNHRSSMKIHNTNS